MLGRRFKKTQLQVGLGLQGKGAKGGVAGVWWQEMEGREGWGLVRVGREGLCRQDKVLLGGMLRRGRQLPLLPACSC